MNIYVYQPATYTVVTHNMERRVSPERCKINPQRSLAGWHKRPLNQVLVLIDLGLWLLYALVVLFSGSLGICVVNCTCILLCTK